VTFRDPSTDSETRASREPHAADADPRRNFLGRMLALGGLAAAAAPQSHAEAGGADFPLPGYARTQAHRSLKQSSNDPTGGNRDFWSIPAGATKEIFHATGAGVISHIWFTVASPSENHLKELVLRAWWDDSVKPSIEAPLGDFFGLNLGTYHIYESAYLACSPGKSLNCYFAMPYRTGARLTVTNEGKREVGAFYSNIDYMTMAALPADALYFHAQYRQGAPCVPVHMEGPKVNPKGEANYVYMESRGQGHLMGVTMGVLQNAEGWWGEGDEMIFVDDEEKPAIQGTGSEDYFLGSWDFSGQPFAHAMYGAPLIVNPEHIGGRYCCYRWHGDNPVTFQRYLKHTIEHGAANDRGDNFYSMGYWYQARPYTDFPSLPAVEERIPRVRA
jgi:hypothetical protein